MLRGKESEVAPANIQNLDRLARAKCIGCVSGASGRRDVLRRDDFFPSNAVFSRDQTGERATHSIQRDQTASHNWIRLKPSLTYDRSHQPQACELEARKRIRLASSRQYSS